MATTKYSDIKIDPETCRIHSEMIKDIHLAVCGNESLGIPGLVKEVAELKSWRRNLELRVAGISSLVAGLFSVVVATVKHFVK